MVDNKRDRQTDRERSKEREKILNATTKYQPNETQTFEREKYDEKEEENNNQLNN